jgi:hypothetical protein
VVEELAVFGGPAVSLTGNGFAQKLVGNAGTTR